VLAAVLTYHQKKIKQKEIDRLELSPIQVRQVADHCGITQDCRWPGFIRQRPDPHPRASSKLKTGCGSLVDGPQAASRRSGGPA